MNPPALVTFSRGQAKGVAEVGPDVFTTRIRLYKTVPGLPMRYAFLSPSLPFLYLFLSSLAGSETLGVTLIQLRSRRKLRTGLALPPSRNVCVRAKVYLCAASRNIKDDRNASCVVRNILKYLDICAGKFYRDGGYIIRSTVSQYNIIGWLF